MDFNGKKVAVARFSRPGMNWVSGSIVPLKVGNTAKLADVIAEETGGSVYAIEPAAAYPLSGLHRSGGEGTEGRLPAGAEAPGSGYG